MNRRRLLASLLVLLIAGPIAAQAPSRRLTTIDSLRQFPSYFNLQNVLLRGEFVERDGRIVLRADERDIDILLDDVRTTSGLVEVRAQLLDVGRLEPGDPRLARYEENREPDRWPRPGDELLLTVSGVVPVDTATTPTVRALSLEPWKFEGQVVTVTGQFRGRNLFGDLPSAPARSRYDFVLRSADGAIWVTGRRPRSRGLDLDVDARVDTSRWVQVTGKVSRERTLVTIEATAIVAAEPPNIEAPPVESVPAPVLEPGEVIFSSPTDGELDVPVSTSVRLQFSRGLDPGTIAAHIRATYAGAPVNASTPALAFETSYDAATRSVELTFSEPPNRLRTLTIETLDGLTTFDGAPVVPWSLTFSIGN